MAKKGGRRTVQGHEAVFRAPFYEEGAWRARRRDLRTGKVSRVKLKLEAGPEASKAAWDALVAHAFKEREEAAAPVEMITVGEVVDRYKNNLEVEPATLDRLEYELEKIKKLLGPKAVFKGIILEDLDRLFSNKEIWRDLSAGTKMTRRSRLIAIWRFAVRRHYCRENVAEGIEIKAAWKRERRLAREMTGKALTFDQARHLLQVAREPFVVNYAPLGKRADDNQLTPRTANPAVWWYVLISLRSGLRKSNVIGSKYKPGLTWSMVDLERRTLAIPAEYMKNRAPLGPLPLHDELAEELDGLLKSLGRIPDPGEPIVPMPAGWDLKDSWKNLLRRAGFEALHLRAHDLRHSFASWLGERCPEAITGCLLGHRRGTQTAVYDSHQSEEALRAGINLLPRLLEKPVAEEKKVGS